MDKRQVREMKSCINLILVILVLAFFPWQKVDAEILFNGDWANYIGPFYDENGWKNGAKVGKPTKQDSEWSDFLAFWSPRAIPHTWLFNTSSARNRIQLIQDETSPKKGVVARFEVQAGDHRKVHSGERSEMYKMLGDNHKKIPVTEKSGHEYYAVSIKVDKNWEGPKPESANKGYEKWGSFMQLHSPNAYDSPPAISLAVGDEFSVEMNSGELMKMVLDKTGKKKRVKKNNKVFKLTNGNLRKGAWVQFVLDVVWRTDKTGSVKVYRRDKGKINFETVLDLSNIATLQTSKYISTDLESCKTCATDNIVHYWRVGYYRSTSPGQTNVLWMGPVVRGTEFEEVARAGFGSSGSINK